MARFSSLLACCDQVRITTIAGTKAISPIASCLIPLGALPLAKLIQPGKRFRASVFIHPWSERRVGRGDFAAKIGVERTPAVLFEGALAVGSIGLTESDAAGTIGSKSTMEDRSMVAPLIDAAEDRRGFGSAGVISAGVMLESGIGLSPLLEFRG